MKKNEIIIWTLISLENSPCISKIQDDLPKNSIHY